MEWICLFMLHLYWYQSPSCHIGRQSSMMHWLVSSSPTVVSNGHTHLYAVHASGMSSSVFVSNFLHFQDLSSILPPPPYVCSMFSSRIILATTASQHRVQRQLCRSQDIHWLRRRAPKVLQDQVSRAVGALGFSVA